VDFDSALNPDIVGSIGALPNANDGFDAECCIQVLEYLPCELFGQALGELRCVSGGKVIVSPLGAKKL
jgi:hypothetical protein